MAYCLKCGAYIPDGQSGCLACGYDPEEEKKKAEAESAARSRGGWSRIARLYGNSIFNFLKNSMVFSIVAIPVFIPTNSV